MIDVEVGKMYFCRRVLEQRGVVFKEFNAIVEVTGKIPENNLYVQCRSICVFKNTIGYNNELISFNRKYFIEEVSRKTHPEYFI